MIVISELSCGWVQIQEDDGKFVVDRADPIVALPPGTLVELAVKGLLVEGSTNDLILCGEYRYRVIGVDSGRNIVFQRIDQP